MQFKSDIDIDVGDREQALSFLKHIPASIISENKITKHNSGVYFTEIPLDPLTGKASLDYNIAEDRGYVKVDVLNVSLYKQIISEDHLQKLMSIEPAWDKLYDKDFCTKLTHIGSHYDTLIKMPEAVNSITRLAMFLAIIRPAKRHLIGKSWKEVAETVWEKPADDGYYFKKAHAISYAHLVAININLMV
ncbi:hypothetical protein UFOVP257_113 [uncultured Caudovirales phage]|uniref:Uncharacterized protein n=1 Tax=uncultured Caudovirales phage TaxID=2100421 RepID=A0A6J5LJX5_9CAUD|nr:hypothetical protein UFOVP257_113 [uncultured Caudovirales phage]